MTERIHAAVAELSNTGISADSSTLKKHHFQGYMSEVYSIESDIGHLIVHLMNIGPAQERLRVWEKLKPLSALLATDPAIPSAEVHFSKHFGSHFVVVQKMLEGTNAGERDITETDFADTWYEPFGTYTEQIERIIARIHSLPVTGFGWLRADGDTVRGEHTNWLAFLEAEMQLWLEGIETAERERGTAGDRLVERMRSYFREVSPVIAYTGTPSIVHYDLINPSNLLVHNGTVSGIVDWEYSIAADPAWEFQYRNRYPLTEYFAQFPHMNGDDIAAFRKRVDAYSVLCFLPWCWTHSSKPQGKLYTCTRTILANQLALAAGH